MTGGSSGLGRAIAEGLAQAGAWVVVMARTESALAETIQAIATVGGRAAQVNVDLADGEALADAAEHAVAAFGEPDIVANAAGINLRPPLGESDALDRERVCSQDRIATRVSVPILGGLCAVGKSVSDTTSPTTVLGDTGYGV